MYGIVTVNARSWLAVQQLLYRTFRAHLKPLHGSYNPGGGGGVLPYMGYVGMCDPKGYVLLPNILWFSHFLSSFLSSFVLSYDAFLWLFFCGYVFPRTVHETKKAIILCIS